jgi:sugar phosphate isomerase/epimerase
MIELIEQYLRLGLVHFMAFPETMHDESLILPTLEKVAGDPDFRAVEIKLIENENLLEPVRSMLTASGLDLTLAAQPSILNDLLDLGSLDQSARKRALEVLKRHVDQALQLKAEAVAILSGPDPGGEKERAEALSRTADLITELCEYSRSLSGPSVILEIFDRGVDKKALVGPADIAARLCEMVCARGVGNFGILVDLSHLPLLGESPRQAIEPLQSYLRAAHLGNAVLKEEHPLYGDQHPGFGTPEGINKVPELRDFIHELKNIGFLKRRHPPVVSFEIKPAPGEKSEWVIACAKRTLLRAWALA